MSFYHLVARRWTGRPGAAVEYGEDVVTWDDLTARVARAAGWLRARGAGPGSVVAIQLPRQLELLDLHLGAMAIGAAAIPMNDKYTASEARWILEDSRPAVAVLTDAIAEHVGAVPVSAVERELRDASPDPLDFEPPADAIAAICYTSGTTGRPKGALLTHDNLAATVLALHEAWRWRAEDVLVHALPLFHIHGLFVAQYGALYAGATSVWTPRFDPRDVLTRLEHRGTVFMGVPTFYQRFVDLPAQERWDLSRVRLFTSGSAALPATLHRAFAERFGHVVLERYGMTEVGIVLSNPYDGERRPGAVGFALPGVEARIADPAGDDDLPAGEVGEVRIRGRSVFRGYLNAPEKTAQTFDGRGFVKTGDLGFVDPEGYFHLVGRSRDLVISGGFNVYPNEVEAVLLDHPAVAEAAVVGITDPDLGERVVADVVPADGRRVDPEELLAYAAQHLAPYKRPRAVRIVGALPRNAMGKVQKTELRAAWERPVVRDAREDEAFAIAARNVEMARETEGMLLDLDRAREGAIAVFGADVGARYFIAEIAGQVVGQCMVTTEWSDWRARPVWWLQSVYVAPGWRRRGVYRAMHDDVLARAREAGAGGVRLYVDRRNTAAMDVYRRCGMDGGHYLVFEAMFDEPPSVGDPPPDRATK